MYYAKRIISAVLLLLLLVACTQATVLSPAMSQSSTGGCIQYEAKQKLIHVFCKLIHITDIYNQLKNDTILHMEPDTDLKGDAFAGKVWILNAGITIEKEGGLIIDSTDTTWLKMVPTPTIQLGKQPSPTIKENDTDTYDEDLIEGTTASSLISTQNTNNSNNNKTNSNRDQQPIFVSKNNGNNPNGIHVRGSLIIDSVKITSWDPEKNDIIGFAFGKRGDEDHTKSDYDTAETQTIDVSYVPLDSNYYQNILSNMAKNNYFSDD